jgi:ATP-binding cassette subfamily B multidrug efflux pump
MQYAKPYRMRFFWVVLFAISLAVFAAVRPYLLKETVDYYIKLKDNSGLVYYLMLMGIVLMLEVISQFYFVYLANAFGQDIVKGYQGTAV